MFGRRTFVVISGPPASGKSTLACELADRLQLPLIAKDTIKEALLGVLATPDVGRSRELGRAAVAAMYAVASESPRGAVLESTFVRSRAAVEIGRLDGDVVEVFCRCDRDVAARRYVARTGSRVAGHFDANRTTTELWNDENAQPIAGGWPVVDLDTTAPVDVGRLVDQIRAALVAPSDTDAR